MKSFDPLRVALFAELFQSVPEEMGQVLERVSFSPNIKERRDYSCALFSPNGDLISQAAHIPVHLGAMEVFLKKWLSDGAPLEADKAYICNDPYFGGTHLPDITVLHRVDYHGATLGYVASRAHHADIGGAAPGSFAPANHVHDEGVLISARELTPTELEQIVNQTREPEHRRADLRAQIAANRVGIRRFHALADRIGSNLQESIQGCLEYAAMRSLEAIKNMPAGRYEAADYLEDVPTRGDRARISVAITVADTNIVFDFSDSDPQVPIGLNATEAVTISACCYIMRCLSEVPFTNAGCWRHIRVITKPSTIVSASFPAPVVAGNTETSQRIVDTILQALSKAAPTRIPACSQGTMNNIAFGKSNWAYYETIAGGCGAGPLRTGATAVHSHMTNTRNTPIEALEIALPLRVTQYKIREGSGGNGQHIGGDGVIREFEALDDAIELTLMTERRAIGPPGTQGGFEGRRGKNVLITADGEKELPSKIVTRMKPGDRIRIETPGGGGWGNSSQKALKQMARKAP